MSKQSEPLVLSETDWWQQLQSSQLPGQLVALLRGLINATQLRLTPPTATPFIISLANERLRGGLRLGDQYYQIALFTPNDLENGRRFFTLVKAYPNGKLALLSDTQP